MQIRCPNHKLWLRAMLEGQCARPRVPQRRSNMLVDWHDFVVVETIRFDEEEELPAPSVLEGKQAPAEHEPPSAPREALPQPPPEALSSLPVPPPAEEPQRTGGLAPVRQAPATGKQTPPAPMGTGRTNASAAPHAHPYCCAEQGSHGAHP